MRANSRKVRFGMHYFLQFESKDKNEVSEFLRTKKPALWHCYSRIDVDTLETIYGVEYYCLDDNSWWRTF